MRGAAIHFNQFFEALKAYPGADEAFVRGLNDLHKKMQTPRPIVICGTCGQKLPAPA
jgi:hypothetical protein